MSVPVSCGPPGNSTPSPPPPPETLSLKVRAKTRRQTKGKRLRLCRSAADDTLSFKRTIGGALQCSAVARQAARRLPARPGATLRSPRGGLDCVACTQLDGAKRARDRLRHRQTDRHTHTHTHRHRLAGKCRPTHARAHSHGRPQVEQLSFGARHLAARGPISEPRAQRVNHVAASPPARPSHDRWVWRRSRALISSG